MCASIACFDASVRRHGDSSSSLFVVLQLLLGVQAVVTVGIMCHRVHLINVAKQKEAAKK